MWGGVKKANRSDTDRDGEEGRNEGAGGVCEGEGHRFIGQRNFHALN